MTESETVAAFLQLLGSGDIEAWLDLFSDDIVIETPFAPDGDPRRFVGREALDRRFGDARRRMRSLEFLDAEITGTDVPGRHLVLCHSTGEMGNGAHYANRYCWLVDVNPEGRICAVTEYFDPQPVLALRSGRTTAPQPAADPLDELRDERAIERLMADYAHHIDANDPVGAAACFAPDGVGDYWGDETGRAAIAERLTEILQAFTATSHHLSNIRIDFGDDPDRATAQSYVYAFHRRRRDDTTFHYWGRWVDELVRLDEGWRFARRSVQGVGGYEPGDTSRGRTFPGHPGRLG